MALSQAQGAGPKAQGAWIKSQGAGPEVLIIGDVDGRELIFTYLTGEDETEELVEVKHLQQHTRNYFVVDRLLYKRGV